MKNWRVILLGLFVVLVLVVGAYVAKRLLTGGAAVVTPPTAGERQVLILLNKNRANEGLPPLVYDQHLAVLARQHSADMIKRDYFSHDGPGGLGQGHPTFSERMKVIHKSMHAECIEWGNGYYGRPAYEVAGWMRSTEHRDIILTRALTRVGIGQVRAKGRYQGVQGATVITADFSTAK